MSQFVEIPDKFDIHKYIQEYLDDPYNFQHHFSKHLKFFYGIDSDYLKELVKEYLPEKMI